VRKSTPRCHIQQPYIPLSLSDFYFVLAGLIPPDEISSSSNECLLDLVGYLTLQLLIPSLSSPELIIFAVLLIVGVILIMVLAAVIHFILPIIAAVLVWLFTGNLLYAGAAFLGVAILQLLVRR
jgi:hypothetical protein